MASLKHKAGLPNVISGGLRAKKADQRGKKEDSNRRRGRKSRASCGPCFAAFVSSTITLSPSRPLFLPLYHQPLIPSPTLPRSSPILSSLYTYFGTYLDTPIRWPCIDCGIFSPSESVFHLSSTFLFLCFPLAHSIFLSTSELTPSK